MIFDLLDEQRRGHITIGELRQRWSEVIADQPVPPSLSALPEDEAVTVEAFAAAFNEEPPQPAVGSAARGRSLRGQDLRTRHSGSLRAAATTTSSTQPSGLDKLARRRRSSDSDGPQPDAACGRVTPPSSAARLVHAERKPTGSPASPLLITAGVSALQRRIKTLEAQVQSARDETDHMRRELAYAHEAMQKSSAMAETDLTLATSDLQRSKVRVGRKEWREMSFANFFRTPWPPTGCT